MAALRKELESAFPDTVGNANNTEIDHIVHLHYKRINVYFEYTYLIVLYLVLLMYIYFSVRKYSWLLGQGLQYRFWLTYWD